MSFTEVEFLYFLPAVLLLHWAGPKDIRWQNGLLLVASALFYASWSWRMLGLLAVGSLLDYWVASRLASSEPAAPSVRRRLLLALSLASNLGMLTLFKYEDFFASSANRMLSAIGLEPSVPLLHWALPLGISFYTLQRIGYVLDVYWGRLPASRSLLQFGVFCSFFPQLTAGPISRGSELLPQLATPRALSATAIRQAAAAFITGYALKAWVADLLGSAIVDRTFAAPAAFNAASLWLGALGYAAQVFADFAGYSLMAIGTALLFGVVLPTNFDFPFLSRSLPELWRRWHMTLNRWLFDYIFTPLTTSRGWFRGRLSIAFMLVFLASGLWHGAAWTFVIWGLLHGAGMVVHQHWDEFYRKLCRRDRRYANWRRSLPYQLAAWALTLGFFTLTLIPFRAPSLHVATEYASGLFGRTGSSLDVGALGILALGLVAAYHLLQLASLQRLRSGLLGLHPLLRGLLWGGVVAGLLILVPASKAAFIYQQF